MNTDKKYGYVMSRIGISLLLTCLAFSVGCNKRNGDRSQGNGETAVVTLETTTGGTMVFVSGGSFMMGDPRGRAEETPHSVTVGNFYLDECPVTQEVYERIIGINPSKQKSPRNPVERTQWTDAVRFCNKCSEMEGLIPCYDLSTWTCNFEANGYRLPTEAEWEYACRAQSETQYYFGDSERQLSKYAWFKENSQGKTHPVHQKLPNHFGLYDMHGNVWQWCNDWYSESYYATSPTEDPRGPTEGKMRVLRGGAWDSTADKCRSAYRHKEFPVYSDACFGADSYGFRRARKWAAYAEPVKTAQTKAIPLAVNSESKGDKLAPRSVPTPASGKIDLTSLKGTIVFVSDRNGTMKIWKMHASGKDPTQLTQGPEPDADPRFSPDGKQILYTSLRGGFPEVWQMKADGSEPHFVSKGSQASWSPDGKSIVFIRDNQTFLRDLASGQEKLVTPKEWERCGVPAFSPDGQHLAVASRHLGNIGIFVLSLDGKPTSQLKTEEACCTPCWSKDGKQILCQTVQGHIHQVDVDGKNWEQVTFGADVQHDARYSPDGRLIVFCRAPSPEGPWQICVKRLEGDEDEFVQVTKEGSNLLPDWHSVE